VPLSGAVPASRRGHRPPDIGTQDEGGRIQAGQAAAKGHASEPDVIFSLAGPILLTCPHSLNIVRGGKDGETRRIHKRERHSSEIVLKLASLIEQLTGKPASYIIWNRMNARKGDPRYLDPNYLTQAQSPKSPWHHALHAFQEVWRPDLSDMEVDDGGSGGRDNGSMTTANFPVLHVDVHGKMDRKDNLDLDIGFRPARIVLIGSRCARGFWELSSRTGIVTGRFGPMENCWARDKSDAKGAQEVQQLKRHLAEGMREAFRKTVEGRKFLVHNKPMSMTVEEDPYLNAYWGGSTFETISHQSVNLRMPAVQLEIPLTMRKELTRNDALIRSFAVAIVDTYRECVSRMTGHSRRPRICGCRRHLSEEQKAAVRMELAGSKGIRARSADETDVFLRELNHIDRTVMEKQIWIEMIAPAVFIKARMIGWSTKHTPRTAGLTIWSSWTL
jgi:hypothetical protein